MTRFRAVARIVVIAALGTTAVTLVGITIGWLGGDGAARGAAVVLYLIGGLICLFGFAGGLRGSVRPVRGGGVLPRGARRATQDEVNDAMASSVLLIGLGLLVFLAGIIIDPHARLW